MYLYAWFSVSFFIVLLFLFLIFFLSYYYKMSASGKISMFECGFYSFFYSGSSFSLPFFLISLMFLLFDVEIILLSFFPLCFMSFSVLTGVWFLLFLVLGATLYEWVEGVLSWFLA